jgi:enoyl-CoA hydratase/carnithine racemase
MQVQVEPLSSPNEGISVISLSRSNAKNAIGRQLLRELQEAINTLRQERTTRCVLVRSTCPGTFCAGADLKVRPLGKDRDDTQHTGLGAQEATACGFCQTLQLTLQC